MKPTLKRGNCFSAIAVVLMLDTNVGWDEVLGLREVNHHSKKTGLGGTQGLKRSQDKYG